MYKRNTIQYCVYNKYILQIEIITKYSHIVYTYICEKLSSIEGGVTHFSRPTLLWVHYQYLYV